MIFASFVVRISLVSPKMQAVRDKGGNPKISQLIDLVHARPGLWDKSSEAYKVANKNKGREKIYDEIARELNLEGIDGEAVKNALANLRRLYKRYKKQVAGKSGDGAEDVETDWPFLNQLSFLDPVTDATSLFDSSLAPTSTSEPNEYSICDEQTFAANLSSSNTSSQVSTMDNSK